MAFVKAEKKRINPTVVLEGPTGSGKTYTALSIASGMGAKIAVIDTERSSSAYYADRFSFDMCELHSWKIESYLSAAKEAAQAGYDVLIIDSISHAWKQLTEEMENAAAKYRGNSMTAWTKDGKPRWNRFIDELFSLGMAVIVTSRVKQAYDIGKDENGRTKIEKLGLEAQAEKDFDYEFGIVLRMDQDHNAFVTKDRTGKFQDAIIKRPDASFGTTIREWLNTGAPATVAPGIPESGTQEPPAGGAGRANGPANLKSYMDARKSELITIVMTVDESVAPYFSDDELSEVKAELKKITYTDRGKAALERLIDKYDKALRTKKQLDEAGDEGFLFGDRPA